MRPKSFGVSVCVFARLSMCVSTKQYELLSSVLAGLSSLLNQIGCHITVETGSGCKQRTVMSSVGPSGEA